MDFIVSEIHQLNKGVFLTGSRVGRSTELVIRTVPKSAL